MRVVVVASGRTEQQALPKLLRGVVLELHRDPLIVIPPWNQALTPKLVAQLVQAAYWSGEPRPQKAVVLLDADSDTREAVETAMRGELEKRLSDLRSLGLPILVTSVKWHLETWFFADRKNLEAYLQRTLGALDTNQPEAIDNPKLRLRTLLESQQRVYTSVVAGEIASSLNVGTVRGHSPSFRDLEAAYRNGPEAS